MGENRVNSSSKTLSVADMRHLLLAVLLLLLLLLTGCQSGAPRPSSAGAELPLRAQYQALAQAGPVYAVDAAASKVRIYVYRAGALAARLGHNHVLSAPKFEGYISVPSDQAADARFDLSVPWADLVIDDPSTRQETGGNFSGVRDQSDIDGTRKNMLGAHGFEADRFPNVRLRSVAIEGDWPMLIAQVEITLHGVTQTQAVALHVERSATGLKVRGGLTLKQSDFGVAPLSILGGLVKVQDAVAIQFELVAVAAAF